MITFILGLICLALGCINISIGCVGFIFMPGQAKWLNIVVGVFCLTVGIYDIVHFISQLV